MVKKTILSIIIAAAILIPIVAKAQFVDQRCWEEDACKTFRYNSFGLDPDTALQGFVRNSETKEVCGDKRLDEQEVGFCLPAGKTKTSISFGGKRDFEHIGDLIKHMVRYLFVAATIFSVIMLVISGIRWMMSGVSAEAKQQAIKGIAGAAMGLVLLALSYTILSTINPALVRLRMPQVWLINPQGLAPIFCENIDNTLAYAFSKEEFFNPEVKITQSETKRRFDAVSEYNVTSTAAACGDQYFAKSGGGQMCMGTVCPGSTSGPQVCMPFTLQNENVESGLPTTFQNNPLFEAVALANSHFKSYDKKNVSKAPNCKSADIILHLTVNSIWQELMYDVSLIGIVAPKMEEEWLDWSDAGIRFVGMCKGADKKIYRGTWETWGNNSGESLLITRIEQRDDGGNITAVPDYIIEVDGLVGENAVYEDSFWCSGKELVGFTAYSEMKVSWNFLEDARFFIGPTNKKRKGILGTWGDVGWNRLFSKEMLEKEGIFLEASFTQTTIGGLIDHKKTWVTEYKGAPAQLWGMDIENICELDVYKNYKACKK